LTPKPLAAAERSHLAFDDPNIGVLVIE